MRPTRARPVLFGGGTGLSLFGLRSEPGPGGRRRAIPISTICLDCGDLTATPTSGRCPRCLPEYRARNAKRRKPKDEAKRTERGLRVRAEHHAIVGTRRWRRTAEVVKRRDGFACVLCGATERLTVDHVDGARGSENPYDPDGCQTLCRSCHARVENERRRRVRRGGGSNTKGGATRQGDALSRTRTDFSGEVSDVGWVA